jgi:hypothetical protein
MTPLKELYLLAEKYDVSMKDALKRAGIGPTWAFRNKHNDEPDADRLKRLQKSVLELAKESGAKGGLTKELAAVRETLARIERSMGNVSE